MNIEEVFFDAQAEVVLVSSKTHKVEGTIEITSKIQVPAFSFRHGHRLDSYFEINCIAIVTKSHSAS